ncbi:hypothetical protein AAVH_10982 [Aphelenchoides avenae]|nr:hypothetical protein AAVH_10982 [Aphelenchus avenae]
MSSAAAKPAQVVPADDWDSDGSLEEWVAAVPANNTEATSETTNNKEPVKEDVELVRWFDKPRTTLAPLAGPLGNIEQLKAKLAEEKKQAERKHNEAVTKAREDYKREIAEAESRCAAAIKKHFDVMKIRARLTVPIPLDDYLTRKDPNWAVTGNCISDVLKDIIVKHVKNGREIMLDGFDYSPSTSGFFWPKQGRRITIAEYTLKKWDFKTALPTKKSVYKAGGGHHRDIYPVDIFNVVAIKI